jgi:CheY-like chemotaxis protein/two-component sensor histidine kinase
MLAHELRNPLAPIRNIVQIMRLRGPHPPWLGAAQDVIERNVDQLVRLVDDLLDVSRITLGKIRVDRRPVDLAAVIAQAVEMSGPVIQAKQHKLTVAEADEPITLSGDVTRLTQVVSNLLNNAAKYTEEGGEITLSTARDGGEAVIRVADTGIGLAPEMIEAVFEPFTQVERSLDRSQGGLGIGLTLARRLVEMHDGRITARSDGPGRGSEFEVRLPILTAAPEPAPPKPPAKVAPRRVIVVDDNVDAAETLAWLLRAAGHQVVTAYDGRSAVDAAPVFRPEVVLLDIGLPGMDGYEVARRIRALAAHRGTPIVALSGYGLASDREQSRAAGFDVHLVKPVDLGQLMGLIGAAAVPAA